ncbi:vWA domain-containing protein [Chryseobacterium sp.]|uniref:vWA domain-containing protein n=1 Tax=Chryseobacterium sp. TaxID=1871047 RepID=UPI00388F6174
MEFYLGNYWYLLLLLLIPVLVFIISRYLKWKIKKRALFANSRFHDSLFERKSKFARYFSIFYSIAILFLVLSIVDILEGSEEVSTRQKLNNVIFMIDVSNSMNAEDVSTNRLQEAKNVMIQTMKKLKNDKVGVVIFAGQATSIMPLTTDYSSAENFVSAIETNTIKIQGTDFLKAMEVAVDKFKNTNRNGRKIVLLSDGEDNEGHEDEAIKLANKEGLIVTSVGIGSEEGAPVPEYVYGQLMGYKNDANGQTVLTKRQTEALSKIAQSTGGTYIDGNNINDAPDQIVEALSKNASSSETMVKSQNASHYYQYILAISILFFMIIYMFNPKRDLNI